jgi:hypothetical protein
VHERSSRIRNAVAFKQYRTRLSHILDLFWEESWRSVYAGELEVRPPGAPTIAPVLVESELAPVRKHFATAQE